MICPVVVNVAVFIFLNRLRHFRPVSHNYTVRNKVENIGSHFFRAFYPGLLQDLFSNLQPVCRTFCFKKVIHRHFFGYIFRKTGSKRAVEYLGIRRALVVKPFGFVRHSSAAHDRSISLSESKASEKAVKAGHSRAVKHICGILSEQLFAENRPFRRFRKICAGFLTYDVSYPSESLIVGIRVNAFADYPMCDGINGGFGVSYDVHAERTDVQNGFSETACFVVHIGHSLIQSVCGSSVQLIRKRPQILFGFLASLVVQKIIINLFFVIRCPISVVQKGKSLPALLVHRLQFLRRKTACLVLCIFIFRIRRFGIRRECSEGLISVLKNIVLFRKKKSAFCRELVCFPNISAVVLKRFFVYFAVAYCFKLLKAFSGLLVIKIVVVDKFAVFDFWKTRCPPLTGNVFCPHRLFDPVYLCLRFGGSHKRIRVFLKPRLFSVICGGFQRVLYVRIILSLIFLGIKPVVVKGFVCFRRTVLPIMRPKVVKKLQLAVISLYLLPDRLLLIIAPAVCVVILRKRIQPVAHLFDLIRRAVYRLLRIVLRRVELRAVGR